MAVSDAWIHRSPLLGRGLGCGAGAPGVGRGLVTLAPASALTASRMPAMAATQMRVSAQARALSVPAKGDRQVRPVRV